MEEEYTAEQALDKVRQMFFPEVSEGDTVEQFGYWFVFNNDQWDPLSD
jgi:hypothetical protein